MSPQSYEFRFLSGPEQYVIYGSACTAPLSKNEVELAAGIREGLDCVWWSVCKLQKDSSLYADYCPVTKAMRDELSSHDSMLATDFLAELDGAEQRNLSKPPTGTDWDSTLQLAQVASLAHPVRRNGLHFDV